MINIERLIHGHPINRKFLHTASPEKAITGRKDGVVKVYKGFCSGERETLRRLSHLHDGQCDVLAGR